MGELSQNSSLNQRTKLARRTWNLELSIFEFAACHELGHSTTIQERCNNSAQMTYENWVVSTATVQSCDWRDASTRTQSSLLVGHFIVGFSYAVGDTRYSGKFYSSREWEQATILGMLYNPQNPEETYVCDEGEGEDLSWMFALGGG